MKLICKIIDVLLFKLKIKYLKLNKTYKKSIIKLFKETK